MQMTRRDFLRSAAMSAALAAVAGVLYAAVMGIVRIISRSRG